MVDVSLFRDGAVPFGDWPFFGVAGPEDPCPCGCPRFERLDDDGWKCEGCGEVIYEDCPVPCDGCEVALGRGGDCLLEPG